MSQSDTRSLSRNADLRVEELEGRLVPSGTALDLTTRGSEGTVNEAIFRQSDAQPTGTGTIQSFVRIQGNAALEQGYNTEARPLQFDENKSPVFTRSLKVGDVPLVAVNGEIYREFLLDINQKASSPLLSLDQLRVYVGDAPNLSGYNDATKQLAGLDPVYDLDAGGNNNYVKLNYRLNSGSGSGDMTVLIPAALLGTDPSRYVYLFSAFGENHAANAGFEEWAVKGTPGGAFEPPVERSSLSGRVYLDVNGSEGFDSEDTGIAGVVIMLTGVNDLGQNVVLTTTTDVNGFYKFENLRPGTYSILEHQPEGYADGNDSIGTQGGLVDNDRFYEIALAAGIDGEENNFGELLFQE